MKLVRLELWAIETDSGLKVVDRECNYVGHIRKSRFGKPKKGGIRRYQWGRWIQKQMGSWASHNSVKQKLLRSVDPWIRKLDGMQRSWFLRGLALPKSKQIYRVMEYQTEDWKSASHRMVGQLANRRRRAGQTDWERWIANVGKQSLKRAIERYQPSKNQCETDSGNS